MQNIILPNIESMLITFFCQLYLQFSLQILKWLKVYPKDIMSMTFSKSICNTSSKISFKYVISSFSRLIFYSKISISQKYIILTIHGVAVENSKYHTCFCDLICFLICNNDDILQIKIFSKKRVTLFLIAFNSQNILAQVTPHKTQ